MQKIVKSIAIILIVLTTLVMVLPLFVSVPPPANVAPVEQLAEPDSQFIEINNFDVHYKTSGGGDQAIILLHGFGASVFSWREVVEPLALAGYGPIVAYDRPAFGLTERPTSWRGQNPYSLKGQVELLDGLMDALEIEQAVLVGNSAGGRVAAVYALERPERVRALILVDAAVYGQPRPWWQGLVYNLPPMRLVGPLMVRKIAQTGNDTIRDAWHAPELVSAEIIEGYRKPLTAQNWDVGLWEYTRAPRDLDAAARLNELTLPVLVVTGDDDRIIPAENSIRLAGELSNAELVIFENCGHVPHEECPEAFMEAVAPFLQSLENEAE
jgi:pimeloyl-ACP methyl ester carboxylesterase